MKKILVFCSIVCLVLISTIRTSAQCSVNSSRSITCYASYGVSYSQMYYITPGVPVSVSAWYNFYNDRVGYRSDAGAEVDVDAAMWFSNSTNPNGGSAQSTTFTAADNTSGYFQIYIGADINGTAEVATWW